MAHTPHVLHEQGLVHWYCTPQRYGATRSHDGTQPEELSDPKFHPFWAKAEELGVLVFLHPQGIPDLEKRLQGNGLLTNVIGNPLETTIALSHLIFEGTLDRFPGLKLCAAHGGGYLPPYSTRSDHGCLTFQRMAAQTRKRSTSL